MLTPNGTRIYRPSARAIMVTGTYADGWKPGEVAAAFGISPHTVKSWVRDVRLWFTHHDGARVRDKIELASHLRALGYSRIGM